LLRRSRTIVLIQPGAIGPAITFLGAKTVSKRHLSITDAKGDVSWITIADVLQSNGVIPIVDTVLLPM
jgi:hypothetical protein